MFNFLCLSMEGQEEKRQLPKRERVAPKKSQFFEPHPCSPKTTQDGKLSL